jgi:hypothetical protein
MRFLVIAVFMLIAAIGVAAQDGIYCSFAGGQKVLNVEDINNDLAPYKQIYPYMTDFKPTFLIYSGEVHFIMGKRFVLGGKGFLFSQEQNAPIAVTRKMSIFGNMGVGSLGYTILDGKDNGFRLFPQIGVGLAQTYFQIKDGFTNANQFSTVVIGAFDSLAEIKKEGVVVDACLAMDWDWNFFPSMNCMSGIGCRPLLHAEFGYTFLTKKLNWMRDSDELTEATPEIGLGGLYYSIGFGFGFTGAK